MHAEIDEKGVNYPFKTAFTATIEILGVRWEVWMQFCQMKGMEPHGLCRFIQESTGNIYEGRVTGRTCH